MSGSKAKWIESKGLLYIGDKNGTLGLSAKQSLCLAAVFSEPYLAFASCRGLNRQNTRFYFRREHNWATESDPRPEEDEIRRD